MFAVASIIYALSVPNQYKAMALLAPAKSDGGGLSGALGQMGGLASLAGISLGGGESGEAQIAQEIMKSWSYIEEYRGIEERCTKLMRLAMNNDTTLEYSQDEAGKGVNDAHS